MDLFEQISNDIKEAMKAKDKGQTGKTLAQCQKSVSWKLKQLREQMIH